MSNPQWKGFDRARDFPLLGLDPDVKSDWKPVDDGRRPDNRGPEHFVEVHGQWEGFDYAGPQKEGRVVGVRPDIGKGDILGFMDDIDPLTLMPYQRELALAQVVSVRSTELAHRTVAF